MPIRLCLKRTLTSMILAGAASASAWAAPTAGPAGEAFYTPPVPLPAGVHGDLVWYRPASVNLGAGAPDVKAWTVLYRSTDSVGAANVVTGTVLVPAQAWGKLSPRPVITYAVGTQGIGHQCAPSKQFTAGSEYENANVVAALNAGYAVLVTDYAGYTNGQIHTYLAGKSQGHAMLDIVRAATQIPSSGVSPFARTAIWGYSQGGQTAAWAGELRASYVPNMNVVGVAAGGIPADFVQSAYNLDGRNGSAFLLLATIGLSQQYPDALPFDSLINDAGRAAATKGEQLCLVDGLFAFMNRHLNEYTIGNIGLDQLLAMPSIRATLEAQNLGKVKIDAPFYQYHGQADWALPLAQAYDLKKKYCSKGTKVKFDLYPAEHIITQGQAAPYVLTWLADRFNGKVATSDCDSGKPDPLSTSNPNDGNFVISLKSWPLMGSLHLKTLNSDVTLPAGATFSADADMSTRRLNAGVLTVPTFMAKLKVLGIPIDVKLSITQTQETVGDISIDTNAVVTVKATQYIDIAVQSLGALGINIPSGCHTSQPVALPLNFTGPVSSLGNGLMQFSGVTSFPSMTGCGAFGPILSTLMSGAGQAYTFTLQPPAPSAN